MNYNFDFDDKKNNRKKILKEIIIWFIEIAVVICLAYFIICFAVEKTTVVGGSMSNTLNEGDKVIINKFAYRFTKPKRFDIIVFKQNGKEHSYYNIKRIIGLPGETVQIVGGAVYINDEPLEERFEMEELNNGGLADEKISLDEDEYFVLGDNRNNSEDSRFANIGNITKKDIIGKAWIRLNPFDFINKIVPSEKSTDEEKNK